MHSAMKERDTVWVRDVDGEVRVGFSNVFFTVLLSWEEHGAPVPSMLPAVVFLGRQSTASNEEASGVNRARAALPPGVREQCFRGGRRTRRPDLCGVTETAHTFHLSRMHLLTCFNPPGIEGCARRLLCMCFLLKGPERVH